MAVALLTQARLVYTGYHSASLRFGVGVLGVVTQHMTHLPPEWTRECQALALIADTVVEQIYGGLRAELPGERQIKMYPRLIVLGMLNHERNLTTAEAKASFKKYAIAGVIAHLPNEGEYQYAKMLLEVLPTQTDEVFLQFSTHCTYMEMEVLLAGQDEKIRKKLYSTLIRKPNLCSWVRQEQIIYIRREKQRVHEALQAVIRDRINTLNGQWTSWANEGHNEEERFRRSIMGQQARTRAEQQLGGVVSIMDIALANGDALLTPITTNIAQDYINLVDRFEAPPAGNEPGNAGDNAAGVGGDQGMDQ